MSLRWHDDADDGDDGAPSEEWNIVKLRDSLAGNPSEDLGACSRGLGPHLGDLGGRGVRGIVCIMWHVVVVCVWRCFYVFVGLFEDCGGCLMFCFSMFCLCV